MTDKLQQSSGTPRWYQLQGFQRLLRHVWKRSPSNGADGGSHGIKSGTACWYQQQSFQRLLRHVWERSSFYRDYYGSHGITEKHLSEVTVRDLPLLSKSTLMENFDRAVTDPRLKREELERWIQDKPGPGERFAGNFIVLHSSGTSGALGIFVYDPRAWLIADIAMADRVAVSGTNPTEKVRAALYAATHGHFAMVSMAASLDRSRYDTLILSLLASRELTFEQLNRFQPHRLYGYASSIAELAEWAIQGKLQIRPSSIFVGGDKLSCDMESKIRSAWNTPVHNTYGTSESKFIAVKESDQDEMTVLDELNIVEALDEQNRAVVSAQEGRVVLTNLYNYTLPIIRYELEDFIVLGKTNEDGYALTIREIKGRVNDFLPVMLRDSTHDTIHPIILSEFHVPSLEKVQFISKRPDFLQLNYVAPAEMDLAVRKQFQQILDSKDATPTKFEVKRFENIESDPRTGKLRLVRIEHEQSLRS